MLHPLCYVDDKGNVLDWSVALFIEYPHHLPPAMRLGLVEYALPLSVSERFSE